MWCSVGKDLGHRVHTMGLAQLGTLLAANNI